jgi:hypothetical protein
MNYVMKVIYMVLNHLLGLSLGKPIITITSKGVTASNVEVKLKKAQPKQRRGKVIAVQDADAKIDYILNQIAELKAAGRDAGVMIDDQPVTRELLIQNADQLDIIMAMLESGKPEAQNL